MDTMKDTPAARAVNPRWKVAAAVGAVLALSAPAAVGVYRALEPTRGPMAAGLAAAGIELAYLSLSLLTLRAELRPQARLVAVAAVATSITLNVLADYAARVAGGLASWDAAVARFDPLAVGLAVLESAPLAGLAFALASLLHRLAEAPEQPEGEDTAGPLTGETVELPDAPAWAGPVVVAEPTTTWARELPPQVAYPAPTHVKDAPALMQENAGLESIAPHSTGRTAAPLTCPRCSTELDRPRYLAARRWGHCAACKTSQPRPAAGD